MSRSCGVVASSLSLSGYTATEYSGLVESISTRTVAEPRFVTLCAPSGPGGNATISHCPSSSSPAGVRTTTVPSSGISHSSSGHS